MLIGVLLRLVDVIVAIERSKANSSISEQPGIVAVGVNYHFETVRVHDKYVLLTDTR